MKASSKRSREGRGRKGGGGEAVESEAPPASPPLAILLNRDHTQPEPSAMPTTAHITSTTSFLGHFSELGQHLADQDMHPVCDPPISTICTIGCQRFEARFVH